MSDPVTILGTMAVGFAVSKIAEKLTGSETLGMVAGLAAGGWAGSAISGYQAAQAAGTAAQAAGSAAKAGSALKVAGAAPLGGAVTAAGGAVPAASPIAAQAAAAAPTAAAAAPSAVTPAVAAAPAASTAAATPATAAKSSFLGFSPDELLKVAAGGISGMAEYKQKEKDREIDQELIDLKREQFEEDNRRYAAQGAYGVTNTGRVVPINAGQQLQAMNQRLGYMPHTSMGTMTNMSTIQRPEGGYVSRFGRFSKGGTKNA